MSVLVGLSRGGSFFFTGDEENASWCTSWEKLVLDG